MKQLVTITLLYMALSSEYPIDLSLLFFLSVHEKKNYRTVFGYFIIICVFSLLKVREWEKKSLYLSQVTPHQTRGSFNCRLSTHSLCPLCNLVINNEHFLSHSLSILRSPSVLHSPTRTNAISTLDLAVKS